MDPHTAAGDPQTLTGGSAQSLVGSLLLSTGSWGAQAFVCALQESLFSPVLWNFCNQTLLTFKVRFSGGFQFLCWIPQVGESRSQSYQKGSCTVAKVLGLTTARLVMAFTISPFGVCMSFFETYSFTYQILIKHMVYVWYSPVRGLGNTGKLTLRHYHQGAGSFVEIATEN